MMYKYWNKYRKSELLEFDVSILMIMSNYGIKLFMLASPIDQYDSTPW